MSNQVQKKGKWITNRARGHSYQTQWTVQGEPINNHQPRRGTRHKASRGHCHCDICSRNTKEAKEKLLKKDFEKAKKGLD